MFISFANFIQSFNKIVALFILMLKTSRLSKTLAIKVFRTTDNIIVKDIDNSKTNKIV